MINSKYPLVPLSDIAIIYNGNSINKRIKQEKYTGLDQGRNFIATKDIDFDGTVNYENGVKIPFDESSFKTAPSDCVFVCSEGGSAGKKTAYITQQVCFGNKLYAIVGKDDNFVGKYVYYFTRYSGFSSQFKDLLNGIIGGVSLKKFGSILIPYPSKETQESIVEKIENQLSQLDSAVETLNKTKQQLEIYRQAVLKEAFQGKLSSHRPVSYSLPYLSSQESNGFPPIANEWKYIKLSCLGELARGKSKHRPRNDRKLFENGKYPFVQTGDVKKADKYITDYENMYGDFGLQQSKLWKKGTLCITIAANIAETAFLGIDACFPDSVVGFLPSEYVLPEYIRYFIESQKVRLWAFAPATAQKNINLKTLENLVIPYCSIEEQAEIIKIVDEKMSVCDRFKQVINQSLQQAEALRQSILKQAFSMMD